MDLHVHQVNQFASGGSHVTIFEADVELGNDCVTVEILATDPEDASQECVELAKKAIQRGVERVLRPRGQGAIVRVSRIVIHPIDFKSKAFERYTAEAFERLMS